MWLLYPFRINFIYAKYCWHKGISFHFKIKVNNNEGKSENKVLFISSVFYFEEHA